LVAQFVPGYVRPQNHSESTIADLAPTSTSDIPGTLHAATTNLMVKNAPSHPLTNLDIELEF
jgi:hypothetical protein